MKKQQATDLPALLPEDVLAGVLGRLAPRGVATCRCVCKAWRVVIDAHALLRAELLPRSLAGILVNFHGLCVTEFFSRPGSAADSSYVFVMHRGDLTAGAAAGYYPPPAIVTSHCNGLLLIDGGGRMVVNPATGWRARLPPSPPPRVDEDSFDVRHLVYDPAVSPHYEVLLLPRFRYKRERGPIYLGPWREYDPMVEQSEWPPSPCVLRVFSSEKERWEERSFIREGKAAVAIADMRSDGPRDRNSVYWREALYVHCQTNFVMRISLSNNTLRVVKPPIHFHFEHAGLHLGKSEKGVYFASVHEQYKLKVWFLDESCCRMEWVLKHEADLTGWFLKHDIEQRQVRGPWTLRDIDNDYNRAVRWSNTKDDHIEAPVEEIFEWDSEDENLESYTENEDADQRQYHRYIDILGFHPYKEIIFLGEHIHRGLAYHLNSMKVQDLGNLYPTTYDGELSNEEFIDQCFTYTPSWIMRPTIEQNNLDMEGHIKC